MSSHWKNELERLLHPRIGKRLVLVGVGNPLRGDDGVGSLLARRMRERGKPFVLDGGTAPENCGEPIAALAPETVLVVDAARCGGDAGAVRIFRSGEIAGGALSTHDQSLRVLAHYLKRRCGCEMLILGVEPASVGIGEGLSAPVRAALDEMEAVLLEILPDK
ncbi:MAG: hydrogenase 3 maturation endopeptidase HyCI [Candidatus Aureabacteria bacterium]|nr:hydrogenase 3 maturation endopeptidase HyCI [Candidatus Auribacterota bacterium]